MSNNCIGEKLEWNVFAQGLNRNEIVSYNIFDHGSFKKECDKSFEQYSHDFKTFEKEVEKNIHYYFWSKCEWEIVISDLFGDTKFQTRKVDVYDQVKMNWQPFINYVWQYYTNSCCGFSIIIGRN